MLLQNVPLLSDEEKARYPVFGLRLDTLALPGIKQVLLRDHYAEKQHLARLGNSLCKGSAERLRFYTNPHNQMSVIVTLLPYSEPERGPLHVSIALRTRLPTWEEYKAVKEATFGPDLDAMQILPRAALYYNYHPFCLHLWEMPMPWRIDHC